MNTQKPQGIRIGIIGMGSMGKGLLYQSHITPGIECVAVCHWGQTTISGR